MTCQAQIQAIASAGLINNIPELQPNLSTSLAFSPSSFQLIRVSLPSLQVVQLSVTLQAVGTINARVSVYNVNGSLLTFIGQANLGQNTLVTLDLAAGTYVLCFAPLNSLSYSGALLGAFTGFPSTLNLTMTFRTGESASAQFQAPPPPRPPCNDDIAFSIVDGALPPGMEFDGLGRVSGWLPNLDNIADTEKLSPSQNWFYSTEGKAFPWGKRWRFKVRAFLESDPSTFDEKWFCVSIHNNWDFDRDRFLQATPFQKTISKKTTIEPHRLPKALCNDCDYEVTVKRQPIDQSEIDCETCAQEPKFTIVAIPDILCGEIIEPEELIDWLNINQSREFENNPVGEFIRQLKAVPEFERLFTTETITISGNFVLFEDTTFPEDDFDFKMLNWRDDVNQSLPITANGHFGEQMMVTL